MNKVGYGCNTSKNLLSLKKVEEMIKCLTTLFFVLLAYNFYSQEITGYQGKINIQSLKKVKADFNIHFSNSPQKDTLRLFINKNADIKNLTFNERHVDYVLEKVENDLPDIKEIVITQDFPTLFTLNVEYEYPLTTIENETFQYDPNWIELNNFTGWFPFNRENTNFKYQLKIKIPPSYELASPGNITKKTEYWIIGREQLTDDIPVVISNNFEIFKSKNNKISFYSSHLNQTQKNKILEDGNSILSFYQKKFGKPILDDLVITINPFSHPWSYTRKGFISLSLKDNYKISDRLRLAHEISHLWWSHNKIYGNGNDWLNEAFAEYSSLIWYKQHTSKDEFDLLLEKYREAFKLDLKITQVRPKDKNYVAVTYYKGAYWLYRLNEKIGAKKMMKILNEVNKREINETSEFISILREKLPQQIFKEMEDVI